MNNSGTQKYWFNGLVNSIIPTVNNGGAQKYWFNGMVMASVETLGGSTPTIYNALFFAND